MISPVYLSEVELATELKRLQSDQATLREEGEDRRGCGAGLRRRKAGVGEQQQEAEMGLENPSPGWQSGIPPTLDPA